MPCRSLVLACSVLSLSACVGGKAAGDCPTCPSGEACGPDNRCHSLCVSEKDCDLCSQCTEGICQEVSGAATCSCTVDADCDDGDPCNGAEVCHDEGDRVVCRRSPDYDCGTTGDPCIERVCVAVGGVPTCEARRLLSPGCQCTAESDAEICTRLTAECGTATTTDNCGATRHVTCGPGCNETDRTCDATNHCACIHGESAPGVCCVPLGPAELCLERGFLCGTATVDDNCGESQTIDCGNSCATGCNPATHTCYCTQTDWGGGLDAVITSASVDGYQDLVMGAAADATRLFVLRGNTCGYATAWIYDGALGASYVGTEITGALAALTPPFVLHEEYLTLAGDGVTLIGKSSTEETFYLTERNGSTGSFSAPSSTAFVSLATLAASTAGVLAFPVLSDDGTSIFFFLHAGADDPDTGAYEARRADTASAFGTPAKIAGAINDGDYVVSGVSHDRLTLYTMKDWATHLFFRATLDETPALVTVTPIPGWRAKPVLQCRRLIATVSSPGCIYEQVGAFYDNW